MKRFIYFAFAGGIAAALNFGSRILLSHAFAYSISIVIAYLIGMVTAFVLNRVFVFPEGNEDWRKQAGWFAAVNVFAVVQTLCISLLLARVIFPATGMVFHPETLAHAVGVIAPIFTSYLGHKKLTFRTR